MQRPALTRAAVFVLSSRLNPDVSICVRYCLEHRYHMVTIIQNNWRGAIDYVRSGRAEVLVIADEHSLRPAPRVEIVSHRPSKPGQSGERTRIIRRMDPPDHRPDEAT